MDARTQLDSLEMTVLRYRFEAINREMAYTLARTGRSGVLNTAQDFSCTMTDSKLRTISAGQGLPIHLGAIQLALKAVLEKYGDDIAEGDLFANNDSYLGNTHCADLTLCAPVFHDGKLAFFSLARAHLSDIGFPTPTTYSPFSRDHYAEGLTLPCVRIQRQYQDVPEIVALCKANIRAPEQFYGDYLAITGAVRIGERRGKEICAKFGISMIEIFLDQHQDYATSMARAAIARLPKTTVHSEAWHDGVPGCMHDGIPVRATVETDPDGGVITIDLRKNVDCLPNGLNMSEATVLASCVTAVLNMLGPEIPRASGAFDCIRVLTRENSAIGRPLFPAATSAATTNLAHILIDHIQAIFADITVERGAAYGTVGNPASSPCVSGFDGRTGRTYVNQIFLGYWGGPAVAGHDGWLTHGASTIQGTLSQSSVERIEHQQPILVEKLELRQNSGGAGRWEGAAGSECIFRVRENAMTVQRG